MSSEFGALLRKLRVSANLSQEALAEAAQISISAIGSYERGIHSAPHRDTVGRLADALGLTQADRSEFEHSARRKVPAGTAHGGIGSGLNRLPLQATSFWGRESELTQIGELLRRNRIVTITGSGGIGKTRLALKVAEHAMHLYPDGAAFVDFGSLVSDDAVVPRLATALKMSADGTGEGLAFHLKGRTTLIVFDNCEHLIAPIGMLAATLVRECQGITILATSRERLKINGEAAYRLPSLPVPSAGTSSMSDAGTFAAVQMFVDRATAIEPNFRLTNENVQETVDICRKLDGIPLALELAASRLPALGLSELRRQVNARISSLSHGNRDLPTRQQTLESTLLWSFNLLDEAERAVFRRLSVFVGGWTLEAAQAVCSDETISAYVVVDALSSLVDKSLVLTDFEPNAMRYRLLQVTRSFASERAEADELEANRARHGYWVAAQAELAFEAISYRPDKPRDKIDWTAWHRKYDIELDNIRAAVAWALGPQGDPIAAESILRGGFRVWVDNNLIEELRLLGLAAIEALDEKRYPRPAALLHNTISKVGTGTQRLHAARRAVELFEGISDADGLARSLSLLARDLQSRGDLDSALALTLRAEKLFRENNLEGSVWFADLLATRAGALSRRGEYVESLALFEQAIDIAKLTDERAAVFLRAENATIMFLSGDAPAAIEEANKALVELRDMNFPHLEIHVMWALTAYRIAVGDAAAAQRDALLVIRRSGTERPQFVVAGIHFVAASSALLALPELAARLAGFVEAHYARVGDTNDAIEQRVYEVLMRSLQSQLSSEAIASHFREGAQLTLDEALAEALSVEVTS
jgi:predicted ATPase/DNA-binding XRE family transcriptional regulator